VEVRVVDLCRADSVVVGAMMRVRTRTMLAEARRTFIPVERRGE
jgi:hypothetical protein